MSASAWLRWPPCCWWASSSEFSAEYCDVVETSSTELRTSSQPAATQRSLQEDLNAPRARARSLSKPTPLQTFERPTHRLFSEERPFAAARDAARDGGDEPTTLRASLLPIEA